MKELLQCGKVCHRLLETCPHLCEATCHAGPCPTECSAPVTVSHPISPLGLQSGSVVQAHNSNVCCTLIPILLQRPALRPASTVSCFHCWKVAGLGQLGNLLDAKTSCQRRKGRAGAVRVPAAEGAAALQPGQAAAAPAGPARRDRRQQRCAAPGLRLQVPPAQGARTLAIPATLTASRS